MRTRTIYSLCVLASFFLPWLTAVGQEVVTKSGTWVTAADRVAATLAPAQKEASPLPDPTAGTYLVVTREDLLAPLEPLLQWKREQGFRVETLVMHSRESDSIRAALQARYSSATVLRPPQRYVLLVGDVDRLQACQGRYTPGSLSNSVTDLYYGEYTGDYVPEALVGRLSVADSGQLSHVVAKIIAYEQGRWAAAERALLAAGYEERANAPTTTNGQVNYLAQMTANYRPELDTVCFYNPASGNQLDSLVRALDQANALVNYTAHCTAQGWNSPAVSHRTIDTLQQAVPTVFVNNCCLSNSFNITCFGEQLLRMADGGAVGVIGATNETLWSEDYFWAVGAKYPPTLHPAYESQRPGAFDQLLTGGHGTPDAVTLGEMNYAGCSAVTLVGSPFDAFYWETYCLLGDPSMTLMMGSQDSLTLTLADSLTAGSTHIEVTSQPWSRISATQSGRLLGTVLTDGDGHGFLSLTQGLSGDSLTLTATKAESIFKQVTLPIATPQKGLLAITEATLEADTLLRLTLRNAGTETAEGHRLALTQDSSDRLGGAALVQGTLHYALPTAPSHSTVTLSLPLGGCSLGTLPILRCRLALANQADSVYSTLPLSLEMEDLRPHLARLQLLDEHNQPLRKIALGGSCQVETTLAHEADSVRLTVNHLPLGTGLNTDQLILPFEADSSEVHYYLELDVHKDRWHESYRGWLLAENNMEDFESGDFSNYPWQETNLYPWLIDSTMAHRGRFSAKSASIADAQRSTMTLEIETLTDDSISFYYTVSSEGSDWLYFFLDSKRRGYWSGNSGWQYYSRALPAGKHRLQWIYQKDASRSERDDCAHIDDIRLPMALWSHPYGHSEADETSVGIAEPEGQIADFSLFPNPAAGSVTLQHNQRPYSREVTLYDIYGRRVGEIIIEGGCQTTQYLTHHLRSGIYTLVLRDKESSLVRKLIVTK